MANNKMRKALVAFILPLVIGLAVGWLIGKLVSGIDLPYSKGQAIVLLVCFPLMYLLVIGWHELGHVVAGRTQDLRFYSLTVGPFSWRRRQGGIRFAWNNKINLAGGLTFMLPRSEDEPARRFAIYAAGGPLASLLLLGVGALAGSLLPYGSFAALFAWTMGLFSFLIFLVTMAPFRAGGFTSDGKRILTLLGKSELAQVEVTALRVIAFTLSDRPLSELPIDAIGRAIRSESIPPQYEGLLHYYQYLYHLATHDLNAAESSLDQFLAMLDTFPAGLREGYYLEAALFHAFETEDLAKAQDGMDRFRANSFTEEVEELLAEAGLARLKREPPVAAPGVIEAKMEDKDLLEPAKKPLYRRWLAKLEEPLGERQ